MEIALAALVGLMLAFANGANDNFKGVATLLGSGTAAYRGALLWATGTTLAGSVAALPLAGKLLAAFSGRGLVPPGLTADPGFPAAVGLGAGATVLLATRMGLPVSTTHALLGGLVGAGLVASPVGIDPGRLGVGFVAPLLFSPVAAAALVLVLYPPLRRLRERLGVTRETCVCIGGEVVAVVPGGDPATALAALALPTVGVGTEATCRVRYRGRLLGVGAPAAVDAAHYLSAGVVSFARGLNDTPKVAALLLAAQALDVRSGALIVLIAMAAGGLLSARRVATTMSRRITSLTHGQGLAANVSTALLVVLASTQGLPVSTTHVSVGSLVGIGATTGTANLRVLSAIAAAWIFTLPAAALVGGVVYALVS